MFFRGHHRLFPPGKRKEELLRWGFLLAVVLYLFHPFFTGKAIGTGDAIWYEHMLADFVLQWRAGVFPVFVGQSEYAFNGAVYPLRVAPLFQHWAGVLDLITFHRLSFFWLQHLVVITVAFGGIGFCYLSLVATAPRCRWLSALLAALYLSCPGVMGLVVTQDLYMSWMTLPFLPIVMFGLMRTFEDDKTIAWGSISCGLAALWLGHAPIAFWATVLAISIQLFRLLGPNRNGRSWRRAALAGIAFTLLAQYPFVSLYTLQSASTRPVDGGVLENPERIVDTLQTAFPGCLQPLSPNAAKLADLQLGYALYSAYCLGLLAFAITKEKSVLIFLLPAFFFFLLLFPVPYWTGWFWTDFSPQILRRLTYYWPMQRFYILLASMGVFAGLAACATFSRKWPALVKPTMILVALSCGWSLWQARQFVRAEQIRTSSDEETVKKELPENRILMVHSYGLFARVPDTFSNGVIAPEAQVKLLDPKTLHLFPRSNAETILQKGWFVGKPDANPGVIDLEPTLTLDPRQHYELHFNFSRTSDRGILQLVGDSFFREYLLPMSGGSLAFGSTTKDVSVLDLWTSSNRPEVVLLRFIPAASDAALRDFSHFAGFSLNYTSPQNSPVQLFSWLPLKITTNSKGKALLETPRVLIPGYSVTVNRIKVVPSASSDGLLEVELPAGNSQVVVSYPGTLLLNLSYWIEILAWIGACAAMLRAIAVNKSL